MNSAATIALSSAALSVPVAVLCRRLSGAPGSRDLRWVPLIALAYATYAVGNLGTTLALGVPAVVWLTRLQLAAAAVSVWAWLRFSNAFLARTPGRGARLLERAVLAAVPLPFVPGLAVVDGRFETRLFEPLGILYHEAILTPIGDLYMAGLVGVSLVVLARLARGWRSGVRDAGVLALALGVVVALGANDALAAGRVLDTPYLLDVAFAVPVLAIAWVVTGRFVASARALEALRNDLLADVEARTRDLATALDQLHQTEKLAALGQFANGVAHEVNSPAAVVTANLRYLADASARGGLPPESGEVVADALASMKRINDLVRKLVDAGRIAATPGAPTSVPVAAVVAKAAAEARQRGGGRLTVVEAVPEGLCVRARRDSLEQIVGALVTNAFESVQEGRTGRIDIRAERVARGVRLTVRDDGGGMAPEVLRRAFDPFFTTKPAGRGAGLGLAVVRGLVDGHGGSVWLESSSGAGTTAYVELPAADADPAVTPPAGP
jgi:signal transduction histidine kinase